jgi:hypothetical protein
MRGIAAVALLVVGCGSSPSHPAIDAPPPQPDAAPLPAFGDLMPQAGGGSNVLTAPKLMVITYDSDPNRADAESFATQLAASPAWLTQVGEYGVGTLSAATPQHIAGTAPKTLADSDLLAMLHANLGPGKPWGMPDHQTLYAFFIPAGTVLDDGTGSKCCTDYDGYHYDELNVAGVDVAYAANCACPGFDGPGITDSQQLFTVASHEAVEAATDPFNDPPGYWTADGDHLAWTYGSGGSEVSDLCQDADTELWDPAPGMTFALQRSWSNAAAKAGHDPCIGEGQPAYYQTIPEAPDAASITFEGDVTPTHVQTIAMGQTGMVTLHVFADDASAGPFTVTLLDISGNALDITQPTGTFNPGDTIEVAMKVTATDPMLDGKAEAFMVTTKPSIGPATYYYGLVGQ